MNNNLLIKLVDFLQDNTDLASRLGEYGDEETINNPQGEYAQIERYLIDQIGDVEELDFLAQDLAHLLK